MKLIDILVSKLDRWPDGYFYATQNVSGHVYISRDEPKRSADVFGTWVTGCEYFHIHSLVFKLASDHETSIVTCDEWLEAKKDKTINWSGDGLPPVGACEMKYKNANESWANSDFHQVNLVFIGIEVFVRRGDDGHETVGRLNDVCFRPIRIPEQIEAERRDKAIKLMRNAVSNRLYPTDSSSIIAIYDAIKAGKIEGVKIDE